MKLPKEMKQKMLKTFIWLSTGGLLLLLFEFALKLPRRGLYLPETFLDMGRVLSYYSKREREWTHVPLPEVRTEKGREFLEQLLQAYADEMPQPPPRPNLPNWHCSCGRENQHYVSTCVCGKNKRDMI